MEMWLGIGDFGICRGGGWWIGIVEAMGEG